MIRTTFFSIAAASLVFTQGTAFGQSCQPTPDDSAIWNSIKESQNALDFAAYLKEFPQGCNRVVASFKLRQLVPESVALTAKVQVAQDSGWYQAPNNGFLTHGDRVVENLAISFDNPDTAKLSFNYTCDAAGRGVTRAANGQACPTNGRAPIQGYGVVLSGSYSQFYDLKYDCTVRRGNGSTYHGAQPDGSWCGAHGGTPSEYVVNVQFTVTRKPLN
jgi:hypothetical protein